MGVVAAGVVAVVAGVAAGLAGDQDPGHRPVTGQPPTRLGAEGSGPAGVAANRPGVAEQAVQVHDHIQLGADPAALGQLPGLEGAAGQLDQGISARWPPLRGSSALAGRARGSRAASKV